MIGGTIQSISIDGVLFPVAGDSDSNRKLGGFESELQMNGNGTARKIMTITAWQIDGLNVGIDDARGDQEFLQNLANGGPNGEPEFVAMTITYASGIVYNGNGTITGEIQTASQAQTCTINLMGPEELTKQA